VPDLLAAPERADELEPAEARALAIRLAPVMEALRMRALPSEMAAPPSSPPIALLTAKQVASRLGVSSRWVYARTRAGRLPFARQLTGGAVRFDAAQLERWISNRTCTP
jgi:excisionase family DNA binding protein